MENVVCRRVKTGNLVRPPLWPGMGPTHVSVPGVSSAVTGRVRSAQLASSTLPMFSLDWFVPVSLSDSGLLKQTSLVVFVNFSLKFCPLSFIFFPLHIFRPWREVHLRSEQSCLFGGPSLFLTITLNLHYVFHLGQKHVWCCGARWPQGTALRGH